MEKITSRIFVAFGVCLFSVNISTAQVVQNKKTQQKTVVEQHTSSATANATPENEPAKKQETVGSIGFLNTPDMAKSNAFVENMGQYAGDISGMDNKDILYRIDDDNMYVYFTTKGIIYKIFRREKVSESEWEKYEKENNIKDEDGDADDKDKGHSIIKTALVKMTWEGSNSDMTISAEDPTSFYFNYYMPDINKDKIFGNVTGYKKILIKNVYPNIDMEYTIAPEGGIKYSYILHPGADASLIKMNYSDAHVKMDASQNIILSTPLGDITDHAPNTYLGDASTQGQKINSSFKKIDNNTIGFSLEGNNNITETTVIDPWTTGPGLTNMGTESIDDIAVDGSDNSVINGCDANTPVNQLQKYNSAGVLQWTLNMTNNYSYTNNDQGDVALDNAGNIYVNAGIGYSATTYYGTLKFNSAGTTLLWGNANGTTSANKMFETWTLAFDCSQSTLVQSGAGKVSSSTNIVYNTMDFETLNTATGAEGNFNTSGNYGEVLDSKIAPNGLLYQLTADSNINGSTSSSATASSGAYNSLICENPGTGYSQVFGIHTGYSFVDGDNKQPGSVGMNAIAASCNYVYTTNGKYLDQRSLTTGVLINRVTVTGGSSTVSNEEINGGIVTDMCGDVYVGSLGTIYEYSPTLTLLGSITGFPGVIYDMALGNNGETIYLCGGTNSTHSSSASSFVASVNLKACTGVTIASVAPTCTTAGSATATPTFCSSTYTYVWTPTGGTAATATGLSAGTYTVTVTGSPDCQFTYSDTASISIIAPPLPPTIGVSASPTSVCPGNSSVLTATGPAGTTYSWSPGAATTNPLTVTPAGTTTYTVTGTNNGCTGTATVTVTVNASLALTANASPTQVCAGSSTNLTATAPSGTTYSWSPGAATTNPVTVTPAVATTYTVTGTNNGCTGTATVTVTINPNLILTANASPTQVCAGSSTTLTATGPNGAAYSWSPGAATTNPVTVTPAGATTYTVTGTQSGCSGTATVAVTVSPALVLTINSLPTSICTGSSGTLTATGTVGTTYSWSTGQTSNPITITPTSNTTYTVTGINGACTATATISVSVNALPTITITGNAATICSGSSATLTANGGSSYSWSDGETTNPIIVFPGSSTPYTVTATDVNGCTGTAQADVTVSLPPTLKITGSDTICNGSNTVLTATGATTYSWSPSTGLSATTGSIVTAAPTSTTTYTLTGSSASGCTNTISIKVVVNALPTVTVSPTTSTICDGGSVTLTGNGTPTYSWSLSTGLSATAGASVTANPVTTTTYTVTGTDANGCINTATTLITVNPQPTVVVTPSSTSICIGSSTALTASGAASYSWSLSTGLSATSGPSVTANPIVTTTYTITGTTSGCTNTTTVTVSVNPLPTVTVSPSTSICMGSSTTLTATGTPNYSWSPATGLGATTGTSVTANPATNTTYTVTGTDGNGCTNTATVTITVNPLPTVTVNSPTICDGTTATLTGTGATSYSWSTGQTSNPITVSPASTTTYTITGTTVGCSNSEVATVTVNPLPTVTVNSPTICSGTSATLTGVGATTYSWSTGATTNPITVSPIITTTYTVTGTTVGCTGSAIATVTVAPSLAITINPSPVSVCVGSSTTLTASGAATYSWSTGALTNSITVNPVSATTYSVTGTSGGCTGSTSVTVTINPLPTITVNSPTICDGTSATLTGGGAVNYSWSTGSTSNPLVVSPTTTSTYTLVGTDGNGCTNSAVATVTVNPLPTVTVNSPSICIGTTGTLTGAGATTYSWSTGSVINPLIVNPVTTTTYTVTGTNGNGCTNSSVATVTVNPLPTITVNSPTICSGTNATLTGSGAVTYSWSTGALTNPITVNPTVTTTYTVTGTDGNGCTNSAIATTIVAPNLVITVSPSPVSICVGSSTALTASGASTYSWSDGETTNPITVNPLSAITYTVTGTSGGCTGTGTVSVTVNPLPTVTVNSPTICAGTGATLTGSGAVTYSWSNGATSNSITVNPATTTSYTLTGTDVNGCTNTSVATVTVNPLPTVTVNSPTICGGTSATLTGAGAVTYSWSDGETTNPITVSPTTTTSYTLTGTDVNGCTNTSVATVTVVPNVVVTINSSILTTVCAGDAVTLTASGAANYSWSTGALTNPLAINPTTTTTYIVTGTTGGCTGSATITVTVNPRPAIDSLNAVVSGPLCNGSFGTVSGITTSGGTGSYTYSWTPTGQTSATATGLPAGSYTLTVTDANGCTSTSGPYNIIASSPVTAIFTADPDSGTVPLQVNFTNGSTGATSYEWNFGNGDTSIAVNPNTTYENTGSYNVELIAINSNGCTDTAYEKIEVHGQSILVIPNVFSPNGDGKNDVFSVEAKNITTFSAQIFDRWGIKVYEWDGPNGGWDGRSQSGVAESAGTYYYLISATGADGKEYKEKGFITLIR